MTSLFRFSLFAIIFNSCVIANAADVDWDHQAGDFLWSNPLNWQSDSLPANGDKLHFAFPNATFVILNGNRLGEYQGLHFSGPGLIHFGIQGATSNLSLDPAASTITVDSGTTVNLNTIINNNVTFNGGGTVVLDNYFAAFSGITVDGANTTLRVFTHAPLSNHSTGMASTRGDIPTLGPLAGSAETITLTNGGTVQFVGYSVNPDSGSKNFLIGAGGGIFDIRNSVVQLDDPNQMNQAADVSGFVTKKGNGRLLLFGNATGWKLTGGSQVEAGFLEFNAAANAFTADASHVIKGGVFGIGSGNATAFNFQFSKITLDGGSMGVSNTNHRYGVAAGTSVLELKSGSILGADYIDGRSARNVIINSVVTGSGTIEIIGGSGAGSGTPALGNFRVVFQRAPATGSTFDGKLILNDSTGIEINPTNESGTGTGLTGNALGNATIEFRGTNTALELRDNGTGSNQTITGYSGINLEISATKKGGTSSLAVTRGTGSNTNNIFELGDLTLGNQYFDINAQNGYVAAFTGDILIKGNATFATRYNGASTGSLQFNSAVLEDVAGRSITKAGPSNSQINALNSINVTTINLTQGILNLRGSEGKIGLGKFDAAALNTSINGTLVLDDTHGVASGNRLHQNLLVMMRGGTISMQSATGSTAQTVENLFLLSGFNTFNATATGSASILRLGNSTTWNVFSTATANFTGTNLGTAGNNGRILINGQVDSSFMGSWATVTDGTYMDYAAYDATGSLGVQKYTNFTGGDLVANYTTGTHIKKTNNANTNLGGDTQIATLNLQLTSAMPANTDTIIIGGNSNLLRIEQGGILTSNQNAYIDYFTAAANRGKITAGVADGNAPATLYITNSTNLYIGSQIVDNESNPLTLVKSGTGTLYLSNANVGSGANSFTGGLIINSGAVRIYGSSTSNTLDALSSDVTLAGGSLIYNSNNTTATGHISSRTITVAANGSSLIGDNNSAATDADGTNTNKFVNFSTLNFTAPAAGEGTATLNFGGYNSTDMIFDSVNLNNTPTINMLSTDSNSFLRVKQLSGSGGLILIQSGGTYNAQTVEYLILGNGSGDNFANNYTGDIILRGGRLVLDKATNTTAITGDVYINGGSLLWARTNMGNQFGEGSKVYLIAGTVGQADEGTVNGPSSDYDAYIPELIMTGGLLNSGRQTMTIAKATISGGTIDVQGISNMGARLTLNNTELLQGAPQINLKGDAITDLTELVLGGSYFKTSGQSIALFSSPTAFSYGVKLTLATDLTVTPNPNFANSYSSGIYIANNRELNLRANIDLDGGNRKINIGENAFYTIQANMVNGGITKDGLGTLILSSFLNESTYDGNVLVNAGTLVIRNNTSLGTAVGSTTVADGATLEVEGSITIGDDLFLSGHGAAYKNAALLSYRGSNTFNGNITIDDDTAFSTYITNVAFDSSARPSGLGTYYSRSALILNQSVTGNGDLYLRGDGYLYLNGGLGHNGDIYKDGHGYVFLDGSSNYTGMTYILGGVFQTSTTLGSNAQGTAVLGGASLVLAGGVDLGSEIIQLHGVGHASQRGSLVNRSGNNSNNGVISIVTDPEQTKASIYSHEGTLSLGGNIISSTNPELIIGGPGNGEISGTIAIGNGTLTKQGSGKWTLSGVANFFTGETTLEGGTLEVETTQSQLSDTSALNFNGGNLTLQGTGIEVVNGAKFNAGGAEINLGSATLNAGSISRSIGSTVNFTAAGNFVSGATNTNGILGAYATVGGRDWAVVNGNAISALTAYTTIYENTNLAGGTPVPSYSSTANLLIDRTMQNLGSAITANTLKITSGLGAAQRNLNLTLQAGGLLYDGTAGSSFGLAGTGTLNAGGEELIFHIHEGTLDVNMIISGTKGITKDGTGKLFLANGNTFTGNIHINEGTLAVIGTSTVTSTDLTSLGTSGERDVYVNGGTFSVSSGSYDVVLNTKRFIVGPDGATFHVGGGESIYTTTGINRLVMNDAGQFSGTGTLIKTGDGRLDIVNQTFNFTGDVIVKEGLLFTSQNSLGGRLANQTITVEKGATLALGATDFDGTLNLNDGSILIANGSITSSLNGFVNIKGNVTTYLQNAGNLGQGASFIFNNRVTLDSDSVWNIYGRDSGSIGATGNGVYLDSVNDISGTVRINTNGFVIANVAGALGDTINRSTVELAGPNARLMLRENSTADFGFNLNVKANSVMELRNAGANSGHYFSINDLNVASNTIFTIHGGNNEQLHVSGVTNFAGTSVLNLATSNVNVVFRKVNGGQNISKMGAGNIFLTDVTEWSGTYTQYFGNTQLTQAGSLLNVDNLVIKGGRFYFDNSQGSYNINRLADNVSVVMYGGELLSSGTETVGSLTVYGSTDIRSSYATNTQASNGSSPHVLTFSGNILDSRKLGGSIDFRVDGGGTLGGDNVNPRIVFTGQTTNTFLGGGFVAGNDWARYDATVQSGFARGVLAMTTYNTNQAETAWAASSNLNLDGSSATTINLSTSRVINTLRFNTGTTRTISLGSYNLTIASGGIMITTSNGTHNIGSSTAHTGVLTAGVESDGKADELFVHIVNGGGTLVINAIVADNGSDPLSVVKASGGNLTLANANNSFTGGLYLNEGTITHTNLTAGLGAANGNIYLQGGTLALRHDNSSTSSGKLKYNYNILARANSTLTIDRATSSSSINGNTMAFNKLIIDDATLTVRNNINTGTAASNYHALFEDGAEFYGKAIIDIARNGTSGNQPILTILGEVSGDGTLYKNNAGRVEFGTADLLDNVANTWTGDLVVNAGEVFLQKTSDTQAIGGNITVNYGTVTWFASNQVADTANIVLNGGVTTSASGTQIATSVLNLRGNAETFASLTINGGQFHTNSGGTAVAATSIVTVLGDVTVNHVGYNDSIRVNALTTLDIQGMLNLYGPLSRIETLDSGNIITNGIELLGSTIRVGNGSGASNLVLKGDISVLASEYTAFINGDNDSDSFVNLGADVVAGDPTTQNVNRIFHVEDGDADDDFVINAVIRNARTGTTTNGFTKTGEGSLVFTGTRANTFTGAVNILEGSLDLRRDASQNSISGNLLNIASGASVRQLNNHQINDSATVTVEGIYDLDYGNASETVGTISGTKADAKILLGPGSALTTNFASGVVTYAGQILGTGASNNTTTTGGVIKNGNGTWRLTGNSEFAGNTVVNGGEFSMMGIMKGNTTYVKTGATLSGAGIIANLVLESGSTLKPGEAADATNTFIGTLTVAGDFNAATNTTIRFQIQSATTTTNFGGFEVGSLDYINFITSEAASNLAWHSLNSGVLDHLNVVGTEGDNGDYTLVSGTQFTINTVGGYAGGFGDVFKLVNWTGIADTSSWETANTSVWHYGGDVADLDLPTLSNGLYWDTRLFSTHGILVVVPEPGRMWLIGGAVMLLTLRRQRPRSRSSKM